MKIHFICAVVPTEMSFALCQVMNWAEENKFKVSKIINSFLPTANNISVPGTNTLKPMNVVICEGSPEEFKKYFGFEYDEKRLSELPKLIAEKQNGIEIQK